MMVLKSKLSALVFGKDQEVAPLTSDSEAIELAPTSPLVPPPSLPGHGVTYLGKVRLSPAPALGPGCTDGAVQELWALRAAEPLRARPARLDIRPFHVRVHVQLPPPRAAAAGTAGDSGERPRPVGDDQPDDYEDDNEEEEDDDDEEEDVGGVATAAVRAQRLLWRKARRGGRGGFRAAADERRRRRRQRRRRQPRDGPAWRTDSFEVARVAFCSAEHRASGLVFAWLYRECDGGGGAPALACHAVECQSAEQAKRLAHTMMEAFTRTLRGMRVAGGAAGEAAAGAGGGGGVADEVKAAARAGGGRFRARP